MASVAQLQAFSAALNERQRAYLLAAYDEDQRREERYRGPGAPPASRWRWIEYGPIGARWLDSRGVGLLRESLEQAGLVDQGTGASWAALETRGLLRSKRMHTGLVDTRSRRPIVSLMVRLATGGRKVARIIRGEPVTRPHSRKAKPLSLSALRLIAYGQQHPEATFDFHAPWGVCPINYLAALGICRGLVKGGYLTGEPPHQLGITEQGMALDVTREANWKPRPRPPLT